jgi:hypothetical protein
MHSPPSQPFFRPERFVDSIEAAEFLGIHPKTLQKYSRSGLVPAHPFGEGTRKLWRYLLSELELWLRTRSNSAPGNRPIATSPPTFARAVDFSERLR